jgi:hypothetical protein
MEWRDPTFVPPLEDMREMSDLELLTLRTDISYDQSEIEHQIRFSEMESDPDWKRRAGSAQHIRQRGINAIKNIMIERTAERGDAPAVPLVRWLSVIQDVIRAAETLSAEDTQDNWQTLDAALERYRQFTLQADLLREVVARTSVPS